MSSADGQVVLVQGRIVWVAGDLFTGKLETIYGSNQPKINPKSGKQDTVYRFGLSVLKSELADPTKGAIWAAMHAEARLLYPSGHIPPTFAWKYKDGDGVDDQGQPFGQREGYPLCLVFTLSTNIQPRFFRWENGNNIQIASGIKCGDYVNVQVKVVGQMSAKPGLYLNPMVTQLVAPGKEIINAPSADQVFGAAMPAPPSNYIPPEQPTMPGMAPAPLAPPGYPAPAAPAPMPAMTAPPPNYGVLPPAHQPPAPAGVYPPQPAHHMPPPGYPAPAPAHAAPPGYPAPGGMPPIPGR